MKKIAAALVVGMMALSGCTSSGGGTGGGAVATAPSARAGMVGTWTGKLQSGASIRIRVPAAGNASYSFKGQSVPVRSTTLSGSTLVLTLANGGSVRLSQKAGGLAYSYRYGGSSASTSLARS